MPNLPPANWKALPMKLWDDPTAFAVDTLFPATLILIAFLCR